MEGWTASYNILDAPDDDIRGDFESTASENDFSSDSNALFMATMVRPKFNNNKRKGNSNVDMILRNESDGDIYISEKRAIIL